LRSMNILQSIQGFMFFPYPCFGFLMTSIYSGPFSFKIRRIPSSRVVLIAWSPSDLSLLLEKGDVKLSPTTSIPWSRINLVARALSSPPEMREIAFFFIIIILGLREREDEHMKGFLYPHSPIPPSTHPLIRRSPVFVPRGYSS